MNDIIVRIINKGGAVVSTQAPAVLLTQVEPASGISYFLAKIDDLKEQFPGCFLEVVVDNDDVVLKRCRKMAIDHLEGNSE